MKIIVGCYERFVICYNIKKTTEDDKTSYSYEKEFSEASHDSCVKCLASGNKYVASGSVDQTIHLYDLTTNQEVETFQGSEGSVNCLLIPDHKHLISAGEDGEIRIWETKVKGNLLHSLKGQNGPISSIAVHPSGKLCLSVNSKDGSVFTWDMMSGRKAYIKNFKWMQPQFVRWSPDGNYFVLSSLRAVHVYQVKTCSRVKEISVDDNIQSIEFLQNDSLKKNCLIIGDIKGNIQIIEILSGTILLKFQAHTNRLKGISSFTSADLSDDDLSWIASVSSDQNLKLWKLKVDSFDESSSDTNLAECVLTIPTGSSLTCVTSWSPKS